ncbi:hypothetical protein [Staphylococcus chromogenes]|uniref:hypothetical protein n=1 Tax=Staphylococcus chromogenes TaxID=46126 RepID=UPI00288775D3|nr:hypothetical protein [Staphylococcus chromogenes]MDT0700408.1 hypothetical protein [Staphylococcus chromogenes]
MYKLTDEENDISLRMDFNELKCFAIDISNRIKEESENEYDRFIEDNKNFNYETICETLECANYTITKLD